METISFKDIKLLFKETDKKFRETDKRIKALTDLYTTQALRSLLLRPYIQAVCNCRAIAQYICKQICPILFAF